VIHRSGGVNKVEDVGRLGTIVGNRVNEDGRDVRWNGCSEAFLDAISKMR
jgi:hypothetical protein